MKKKKRAKGRGKGRPKGSFKVTDQDVINAIRKHEGLLTKVELELGCSHSTLKNYIKRSEIIEEIYDNEKKAHTSKLISLAQKGLEWHLKRKDFKAICFVLKTQGKDEGWSEKSGITEKDDKDLSGDKFSEMSDEELNVEIAKLEKEINDLKGKE